MKRKYSCPHMKIIKLMIEDIIMVGVSDGKNNSISNFEHEKNFGDNTCPNDTNHSCNQDYSEYED